MNNSAYEALRSRPQPLLVTSFTDVKRPGVYEGFITSVGPRDQEMRTARVYIPILNQVMNCSDLSATHSSDKGIGTQFSFYVGDRVLISFMNADPNSPVIVGSIPHTAGLAPSVSDIETSNPVKTPLSNVPVVAEWGFVAEYVQVLGMVLSE
jgi:hypothetical protein